MPTDIQQENNSNENEIPLYQKIIPIDYLNALSECISSGNLEKIDDLMPTQYNTFEDVMPATSLEEQPRMTPKHCRYVTISTLQLFVSMGIRGGLSYGEIVPLYDKFLEDIDATEDLTVMGSLFYNFIYDITFAVHQCQERSYNPNVKKAMRYVKYHLKEKITLKAVAEYVGVTPNYLSSVFVDCMGIKMTEYIDKLKIAEAKRMLSETNMNYTQICDALSFAAQSHFIRVFKKYTGKTPSQYRKNI